MSGIRFVTSERALDEFFKKAIGVIYERIRYNLSYLGELCVKRVRDRNGRDSWFDQTGNLRSSIGYAIYSYGQKQIESVFDTVLGGRDGSSKGRKMVEELASQYSSAYALVVIAAMEYADYVEAIESKDVLASTEIYARQEVGRYLEKAIKEAEKEIQKIEVAL